MEGQELQTRYGGQKSFGGKATVRYEGGRIILRSYATDVAYVEDGKAFVKGKYSETTGRHIREFLKQQGFTADSWAQVWKDYGVKNRTSDSGMAMLRTTGMVAALGEVMGSSKKEKNDWKARMIKAGLGKSGLEMPEDWESLSEDEKERRLNMVIKQLRG